MQKLKILTDSASDITEQVALEYDIEVIGFPINIDERNYREGVDIKREEFYQLMDNSKDVPVTAQITFLEFKEIYQKAYSEGYTDLIYVSISSLGSSTYNNSVMARDEFYAENEAARSKLKIHLIDSKNFTACYGYPVIQAAIKDQRGVPVEEIVAYLKEWFECVELYFAPYTLKYLKHSGRVSAIAAFAGEILGLRPLISIIDGVSSVCEKVRGDKNIIPKLLQLAEKKMIPQTPYIVIAGSNDEVTDELVKEATKKFGYSPEYVCQIGATISSHAGHRVAGIVVRGNKRR